MSLRFRARAHRDLAEIVEWYRDNAGVSGAQGLVDAADRACDLPVRQPKAGSLRFAAVLGVPDIRAIPVNRDPYLVFCKETGDGLVILRVLHARRDIPSIFRTEQ